MTEVNNAPGRSAPSPGGGIQSAQRILMVAVPLIAICLVIAILLNWLQNLPKETVPAGLSIVGSKLTPDYKAGKEIWTGNVENHSPVKAKAPWIQVILREPGGRNVEMGEAIAERDMMIPPGGSLAYTTVFNTRAIQITANPTLEPPNSRSLGTGTFSSTDATPGQ